MKYVMVAVCLIIAGCNKPISLQPLKDAGCAIEQAVAGSISGAVSSALQCSHPDIVAAQLQAAFGNANLCAAPVPAPSAPAAMAAPLYKTIGDVPADALKPKGDLSAKAVAPMGAIGMIACPIAINSAVGFLSNSVPAAWGCAGPNASMAGLIATLTAACEAAVPL